MNTLLTCWPWTVKLAIKLACFQTENEPMERYTFALFLSYNMKQNSKYLIFGHFQSDAVLCHSMFFAHKNIFFLIRVSWNL
jgi:hypothetical protein